MSLPEIQTSPYDDPILRDARDRLRDSVERFDDIPLGSSATVRRETDNPSISRAETVRILALEVLDVTVEEGQEYPTLEIDEAMALSFDLSQEELAADERSISLDEAMDLFAEDPDLIIDLTAIERKAKERAALDSVVVFAGISDSEHLWASSSPLNKPDDNNRTPNTDKTGSQSYDASTSRPSAESHPSVSNSSGDSSERHLRIVSPSETANTPDETQDAAEHIIAAEAPHTIEAAARVTVARDEASKSGNVVHEKRKPRKWAQVLLKHRFAFEWGHGFENGRGFIDGGSMISRMAIARNQAQFVSRYDDYIAKNKAQRLSAVDGGPLQLELGSLFPEVQTTINEQEQAEQKPTFDWPEPTPIKETAVDNNTPLAIVTLSHRGRARGEAGYKIFERKWAKRTAACVAVGALALSAIGLGLGKSSSPTDAIPISNPAPVATSPAEAPTTVNTNERTTNPVSTTNQEITDKQFVMPALTEPQKAAFNTMAEWAKQNPDKNFSVEFQKVPESYWQSTSG